MASGRRAPSGTSTVRSFAFENSAYSGSRRAGVDFDCGVSTPLPARVQYVSGKHSQTFGKGDWPPVRPDERQVGLSVWTAQLSAPGSTQGRVRSGRLTCRCRSYSRTNSGSSAASSRFRTAGSAGTWSTGRSSCSRTTACSTCSPGRRSRRSDSPASRSSASSASNSLRSPAPTKRPRHLGRTLR